MLLLLLLLGEIETIVKTSPRDGWKKESSGRNSFRLKAGKKKGDFVILFYFIFCVCRFLGWFVHLAASFSLLFFLILCIVKNK